MLFNLFPHLDDLGVVFLVIAMIVAVIGVICSQIANWVVGSRRAAHDVCSACGSHDLRPLHHDVRWSRCKSCDTLQSPPDTR